MTNDERKHLHRVCGLGCILCLHKGVPDSPCEIHHPRTGVGAARKSSHFDAIGLCPSHHRLSAEAIHVMGRKAWERFHGVTELELLAQVKALLNEESAP